MYYLRGTLVLALVYLLLTENWEPLNILISLLLALGIVWLLHPQPTRVQVRRLPRVIWAVIRYMFVVFVDVIVGGIQVARLILDPRLPIHPGIVAIPSQNCSDFQTALVAHALSLSPGEIVLEIDQDGVMYTHVLETGEEERYEKDAQRMQSALLSQIVE
jgi:multicomponent Na+:H+ antiporter subunit E